MAHGGRAPRLAQGAAPPDDGGECVGKNSMIDLPALIPHAEIVLPMEIERRKRGGARARRAAIGAVILLSDGSRCVVAGYDGEGKPICYREAGKPTPP